MKVEEFVTRAKSGHVAQTETLATAIQIIEWQREALKGILKQEGWSITCSCGTSDCEGCKQSSLIAREALEEEV